MRRLRMSISLFTAAGGAGAAEDHHVLVAGAHRPGDDPPRVLAEPGGLQPGSRGLGVGVGVHRHDLVADEVLDEGQRAPRGGVVGCRPPGAGRRGRPPPGRRRSPRRGCGRSGAGSGPSWLGSSTLRAESTHLSVDRPWSPGGPGQEANRCSVPISFSSSTSSICSGRRCSLGVAAVDPRPQEQLRRDRDRGARCRASSHDRDRPAERLGRRVRPVHGCQRLEDVRDGHDPRRVRQLFAASGAAGSPCRPASRGDCRPSRGPAATPAGKAAVPACGSSG